MKWIKHFFNKQAATYQPKLLWAACCVAFFGFLRVSEFMVPSQYGYDKDYHLSLTDVTIDNRCSPTVIQLHIKQSKTDPFRKGTSIFLSKSHKDICPVCAIVQYLIMRGQQKGPLFLWPDGTMLTRHIFASALVKIIRNLNLSTQRYNTYSFHIGAATSANQAGFTSHQMKALGRWCLPEVYQNIPKWTCDTDQTATLIDTPSCNFYFSLLHIFYPLTNIPYM